MARRPKNCLVVHAHPDPNSFSAALRDRAVAALAATGATVQLIDLYRPRYQPMLTAREHRDYFSIASDHPDPTTAEHIAAITAADTLVFIYPTWWSGLPAIMKGWLDRTLLPDVAFTLTPSGDPGGDDQTTAPASNGEDDKHGEAGEDDKHGEAGEDDKHGKAGEWPTGVVAPALTNITRIVGITTYGSGRAEVLLLGDAGRRTITRTVRLVCARRCRTTWLGMHRLDTATDEERARFLDRVETKLGGL
ncbi:MAG: NAD(P)H-dependent oxidoreductase [Actinomycetota bacterium]